MARRKAAPKRPILPDPLFKSELLARFVNVVMRRGKKSIAEKIVYGALQDMVSRKKGKGQDAKDGASIFDSQDLRDFALELFKKGLEMVQPTVEVKSRRVGGATYQVPVEVRLDRRIALGMRWLVDAANSRDAGKDMARRLANEILDASEGKGGAIKKREDVNKMAKANQAFAHFRW
jgi:small subunit ribosomal protein S7